MIATVENRAWAGNVALVDFRQAGLSIPSVVRPVKIAAVDATQATGIGKIPAKEQRAVCAAIASILG